MFQLILNSKIDKQKNCYLHLEEKIITPQDRHGKKISHRWLSSHLSMRYLSGTD